MEKLHKEPDAPDSREGRRAQGCCSVVESNNASTHKLMDWLFGKGWYDSFFGRKTCGDTRILLNSVGKILVLASYWLWMPPGVCRKLLINQITHSFLMHSRVYLDYGHLGMCRYAKGFKGTRPYTPWGVQTSARVQHVARFHVARMENVHKFLYKRIDQPHKPFTDTAKLS